MLTFALLYSIRNQDCLPISPKKNPGTGVVDSPFSSLRAPPLCEDSTTEIASDTSPQRGCQGRNGGHRPPGIDIAFMTFLLSLWVFFLIHVILTCILHTASSCGIYPGHHPSDGRYLF